MIAPAPVLREIERSTEPRSMLTHIVACSVVMFLALAGCARQRQGSIAWSTETISWGDHTRLPKGETVEVLNARANNPTNNQAERARAVFTLLARHMRPGSAAHEVGRVFIDPGWLTETKLDYVWEINGWIPVEFEDSVFRLSLFPADSAVGWSPWTIYFRVWPGVLEEDVLEFLKGRDVAGSAQLKEFALCFPPSKPQGRGRIERFSVYGMHVYDEL